jgi:hypothetical protein
VKRNEFLHSRLAHHERTPFGRKNVGYLASTGHVYLIFKLGVI